MFKHRIIKWHDLYYPQWKGLFFWHFFLEKQTLLKGDTYTFKVNFSTLERAKVFIEKDKDEIVWVEE